ncbi:ubiquitin conjugation factor E4 A [Bacillus rossius redtenbacheri]|uniref:ubiquitin conjugation factor E4 A n=1 Tax=Bacillus rossius redtenbacheri TaxID=93214 RepID=UPI002FDE8A18
MSNLGNNPFSGLFSSVNEAAEFAVCQSGVRTDDTCGVSTIENYSSERTNEEWQNNERINELLENVFRFTLNKSTTTRNVVFLDEVTCADPKLLSDIDVLGQALFERLLLEEPSTHVINKDDKEFTSSLSYTVERNAISYLYECFKSFWETLSSNNIENFDTIGTKIKELIFRNVATALKQPELFEDQDVYTQLLDVFSEEMYDFALLKLFINGTVQEIVAGEEDETNVQETLNTSFYKTLDAIHMHVSKSTLFSVNMKFLEFLQIFSSNQYLSLVLIDHSTPQIKSLGRTYANTLIGSFLNLSCLPGNADGQYLYYDDPLLQATSTTDWNVWTAVGSINEGLCKIFHNMLKCSPEAKSRTVRWFRDCLQANTGRGKLWSAHSVDLTSVSEGFMLNLSAVLLRLCRPFCSDPEKYLRIDPTYCSVEEHGLASETCLIPAEEGVQRPAAGSFNFITECFFLAHRALDLSFRVTLDHLMRINQELAQIQRSLADAQSQVAPDGLDLLQAMHARMKEKMTRYLSLRGALMEPTAMEGMVCLHVATAVWLVQVALDEDSCRSQGPSYFPGRMRDVVFPLPDTAAPTLACVPEFLVENLAVFLGFARRFSPRIFEGQGASLMDPSVTLALVFMGSPQRARNPHLRARLAECLESLLPREDDQRPALGPGSQDRFRHHPHRNQIVRTLLEVFVGIEMTGQSVAFEQKFNYRRPMYIVMDYLWQIEEHRQCFKQLAEDAEANMEAVNPPIFLRFINLLMNDAVFLLDESLSNMAQLRTMQTARDTGEWQRLSAQERSQNESHFIHTGMIARFDNILGRETIHTLEFLTSEITSIFCHPTMVDRIASMLNYFLYHLVGPKKKNFKVKDQKEYDFDPANTVLNICKIYVHLYSSEAFCIAVSQDGRSYSPQLFTLAEDVLVRIGGVGLVPDLQAVAEKVALLSTQQQEDDDILSEAPEEFLDPIMSTLMTDPVVLPSSRATVDRSTIARHLLSDQTDPFNRSPLTMDMLRPDADLRERIREWVAERRRARHSS